MRFFRVRFAERKKKKKSNLWDHEPSHEIWEHGNDSKPAGKDVGSRDIQLTQGRNMKI